MGGGRQLLVPPGFLPLAIANRPTTCGHYCRHSVPRQVLVPHAIRLKPHAPGPGIGAGANSEGIRGKAAAAIPPINANLGGDREFTLKHDCPSEE